MLVLNRKEADAIVINGTIKIKVLRIKRHTICLGIDAPLDVSVLRSELAPLAGESQTLIEDSDLPPGSTTGRTLVSLPR